MLVWFGFGLFEIDGGRGVRTSHGDFSADDLGHALEPYLEQIADVLVEHRHRKTLVFLPLIAVSKRFAEICCERGLLAEHVDGQTKERKATLERFKRDETRILCNAMLLTEGYDEPSIDCIVCLRPTKVRALYSQIIGRGIAADDIFGVGAMPVPSGSLELLA